jgi:hypothetical protein
MRKIKDSKRCPKCFSKDVKSVARLGSLIAIPTAATHTYTCYNCGFESKKVEKFFPTFQILLDYYENK